MNKIKHFLSTIVLISFIVLAIGSDDTSSSSGSSSSTNYDYYCDECGSGIYGQPYQCIFYNCVESKSVASGLPTFCSCSCGIRYMRRDGFDYDCY